MLITGEPPKQAEDRKKPNPSACTGLAEHLLPRRHGLIQSFLSKVKGYRGSYLLRREAGAEVEFITIMLWDSIDAIRAVAGKDYEMAVIPEQRRKYLSRYDAKSTHYEIASIHKPTELSSIPS